MRQDEDDGVTEVVGVVVELKALLWQGCRLAQLTEKLIRRESDDLQLQK